MSNQSFRWAWCAVVVIFCLVVVQSDADVAESALNDIEHKSRALSGLASIVPPHSGLASFIAGKPLSYADLGESTSEGKVAAKLSNYMTRLKGEQEKCPKSELRCPSTNAADSKPTETTAGYGSATATYEAKTKKYRQKEKKRWNKMKAGMNRRQVMRKKAKARLEKVMAQRKVARKKEKKCWNKMKAGMNRRQAMRKKAKARLEKVMAQRKVARKRQREALMSRMKVVKAMKTQIKAYKAMAEAPKGGAAELAESRGGSAAPAEKKKAAMAEIAKAAAAVAKAEESGKSASKTANEAQKAQTAAETEMERADVQAQKDEAAADMDGSAPAFSLNSTFATQKPASDGLPVSEDAATSCLTQITVAGKISKKHPDGKRKHKNTCTSCKPNHALVLRYHKSMAGSCVARYANSKPVNACTEVNKDTYTADLTSADTKNIICTKVVTVRQTLAIWNMGRSSDPRREFFKSVSNGKMGTIKIMGRSLVTDFSSVTNVTELLDPTDFSNVTNVTDVSSLKVTNVTDVDPSAKSKSRPGLNAYVHCRVWKQTLCMGGKCDVKKEIECDRVCAADSHLEGEGSESSCSKDLCNFQDVPLCKETSLIA